MYNIRKFLSLGVGFAFATILAFISSVMSGEYVMAVSCTMQSDSSIIICDSIEYKQDSRNEKIFYQTKVDQSSVCQGADRSKVEVLSKTEVLLHINKSESQGIYGGYYCKRDASPTRVSMATQESQWQDVATDASLTAIIEGFGKNLDGVRTKFNNNCRQMAAGQYEQEQCRNSFPTYVKQCLGRAENEHSLAIGRHQSDESARKLMDEKFSSCLSDKTGVSKSDILTAINGLDLLDILRDSNNAHNTTMQEYKDKESCEDAGFEWDDDVGCSDPNASSCSIGGVGWFLCPVIDFMAEIADKAYELLAETFLMIPSSMFESNGETYNAWKIFQSIANVILVIAFLVIVFSQLTGFGLSNYGIKKSLPKLIIVAILMNLSFIICALAVDLSNIIGVSLKSLFETMAQTTTNPKDLAERYTPDSTGNPIAGIMTGAAIGGVGILASGGVTLALIAFMPVLLAIVLSLILIFFILVGRQAIIILLVVISPLAFAMYLLPNTQVWFTKWRKTFLALLMVFPIIGLVYGVSDFASNILSQVYQGAGGVAQEIGAIVAAGILAIPFFLVPSLLKKSLDAVGNIGAMAGNLTARASRGLDSKLQDTDMAKAKRQQHRDRTQSIRAGRYGGSNPFNKARSTMNTKLNSGQGAYGQYRRRQVEKYDIAREKEATEFATFGLNQGLADGSISNEGLIALGSGEDAGGLSASPSMQKLAQAKLLQQGTDSDISKLVNNVGKGSMAGRRVLAQNMYEAKRSPAWAPVAAGNLMNAEAQPSELTAEANKLATINSGGYSSADAIANAIPGELNSVSSMITATDSQVTPKAKAEVVSAANLALTEPSINAKIGAKRGDIEKIARI